MRCALTPCNVNRSKITCTHPHTYTYAEFVTFRSARVRILKVSFSPAHTGMNRNMTWKCVPGISWQCRRISCRISKSSAGTHHFQLAARIESICCRRRRQRCGEENTPGPGIMSGIMILSLCHCAAAPTSHSTAPAILIQINSLLTTLHGSQYKLRGANGRAGASLIRLLLNGSRLIN